MSPIDDELRTALQRRATSVAPSPDPLAGIERRAGRMRRNRLAASVAGSVLAVAAVATAVPLLSGPTTPDAPPVALTPPSAVPSAVPSAPPATSPYVLDPAAPWAYRGTPVEELGQGFVATVTQDYAARFPDAGVALTPLWGQLYEPSGQAELVFLAEVEDEARWGLVTSGESGSELLVDEPLPEPAVALAAALPGDEVARLVVVAAPTAGMQYGPDGASGLADLAELAPGVGTTALEGDPQGATYRVLDPSGTELLRAAVPPVAAPTGEGAAPEQPVVTPTNVLDWPLRGTVPEDALQRAEEIAAEQADVPVDRVVSRPLFGGELDGRSYGLAQVWFGGDAQALAWVTDVASGATTGVLLPPTAPRPAVLAAAFEDVVMVVPEPQAGQVLHAPDGDAEPVAVPDQGTEAAVLVARAPGAVGDRLLVLDGNGDPDRPVFRGTVDELLAASSS